MNWPTSEKVFCYVNVIASVRVRLKMFAPQILVRRSLCISSVWAGIARWPLV